MYAINFPVSQVAFAGEGVPALKDLLVFHGFLGNYW